MRSDEVKKLIEFIINNPPSDKEFWNRDDWERYLDNTVPNWRKLLKDPQVWDQIKGIRPKCCYFGLLEVILKYAPPEILKIYLESESSVESENAFDILIEHDAQKLTIKLWKILNEDTKTWIIVKIANKIKEKLRIEIRYLLEEFEKYWKIYPYRYTISSIKNILLEKLEFLLHPLWIKLKETVRAAGDKEFLKKILGIESSFKEVINDAVHYLFEKANLISNHSFTKKHHYFSKNVILDPSLFLDREKAKAVFNFIKEYHGKFNFYVPYSFYAFLKDYKIEKWRAIIDFFEVEEKIYPEEVLDMFKKYERYFNYFEISKEFDLPEYNSFYEKIREIIKDAELSNIIFEIWIFLQEFSFYLSEKKKIIEILRKAGALIKKIYKDFPHKIGLCVRKIIKEIKNTV